MSMNHSRYQLFGIIFSIFISHYDETLLVDNILESGLETLLVEVLYMCSVFECVCKCVFECVCRPLPHHTQHV